jgi:hypothetical protein
MKRNIIHGAVIAGTVFLLLSCIFPVKNEVEWRIRDDGSLFIRQWSYDLYSPEASTNKALKDFVKLVDDWEPGIISETPHPDNPGSTIIVRELQEKYGGLNSLEETVMDKTTAVEVLSKIASNGYYWMEFNTNDVSVESNGNVYDTGMTNEGIFVRWPTNMTYFWYKTTQKEVKGVQLVDFWHEYIKAGRNITVFQSNMVYKYKIDTKTEKKK